MHDNPYSSPSPEPDRLTPKRYDGTASYVRELVAGAVYMFAMGAAVMFGILAAVKVWQRLDL